MDEIRSFYSKWKICYNLFGSGLQYFQSDVCEDIQVIVSSVDEVELNKHSSCIGHADGHFADELMASRSKLNLNDEN